MSNDVIVKVNNFISNDEIKVLRQYCEGTEVDWNVGGQPADTIWYNRVIQAAQLPITSPIRRLLYSIAARTRRQIETYGTGPLYLQTLQIVKWQKGDKTPTIQNHIHFQCDIIVLSYILMMTMMVVRYILSIKTSNQK